MASSSYYYGKYKECERKIKTLDKSISELVKIRNSVTGEFYDEQANVNKELDDLREDLQKAVRHEPGFTANAGNCDSHKEKTSTADAKLSGTANAVENEIASLEAQKRNAEYNKNLNQRRYREEKEKERG